MAKLLFLAALILGPAGPVAALVGLDPIGFLDHRALRIAGTLLASVGVAATLLAQANMGSSWRVGIDPDERTPLVTTGAFAVVRNPIFTTMTATTLGLMFMVGNLVSAAATAILIASIQMQVRAVEEPYLLRTHGPAYSRYAARVGRFLPGLGTIPAVEPTSNPARRR